LTALVSFSWRRVGAWSFRPVTKTSLLSAWESWIRVPACGPGIQRLESGSVSPSVVMVGPPDGLITVASSATPNSGVSLAVAALSCSV
jgi:hypothetical protein